MKKKKLLILACIALLFGNSSFASDIYDVAGNNYSYLFDVYNPSDAAINFAGETLKSPFVIYPNYLKTSNLPNP